nr:hypothetical protein [Tanacetum cinerariifolium]
MINHVLLVRKESNTEPLTVDSPFSTKSKSSQDNEFQPSNDGAKMVNEDLRKENECNDQGEEDNTNITNRVNTITSNINAASSSGVNVVDTNICIDLPPDPNMPSLEDIGIFEDSHDDEDVFGAEADFHNLDSTFQVSPILTTRIYKDHPLEQVIGDFHSAPQTRRMIKNLEEHGLVLQTLKDPSWIETMKEELLQFKLQDVRTLVDLPQGKRAIGSKWVFKNKMDERGIVIRNKTRLVAQGHTQEEDFIVYQMDVKSVFLSVASIEEEVYVCQPPGFEDIDFPDKVYKVEKALYGLHQAPRACQDKYVLEILKKFAFSNVKKASKPMEIPKPLLKDKDGEEVDVHMYRSMIGSLMYLTSSRPDIMFAVCACARYQVTPKVSHLHAVKRIFRYLKGQPKLGVWYPKDSPFDLVAYTDSDYAGASLDRKSTTEGCQFLGCRLISWQCKKQTMLQTLQLRLSMLLLQVVVVKVNAAIDVVKLSAVNTIESAIICLAKNQKFNFSKYILDNLKNNLEVGVPFYMFPRFIQRKHKPRRKEKKETEVSPTKIHTKDHVLTHFNDPLPSGEDRMQLKELMDLCTNLSNKVLDLKNEVIETKSLHKVKIEELESRVKKLEEENMSLTKEVKSFNTKVKSLTIKETVVDKEESSKQKRKITNIDADVKVNMENVYNLDIAYEETVLSMQDVDVQSERIDADVKEVAEEIVEVMEVAKIIVDEVSTAGGELNAANKKTVSVAPTNITTAQPSEATNTTVDITTAPKAKGIVFHDKEESTTRTGSLKSQAKDKSKAKLVKEPKILKLRKAQISLDEEVEKRIKAEWNAAMKDNIDWNEAQRWMQKGLKLQEREQEKRKWRKINLLKKQKGDELKQDNVKKQKLEEQKEAREFKKNLEIVLDDEDDVFVNVTPLSSKTPTIMDYKIYKEGKKEHFQIIRANDNVWKHQKGPQGLSRVKNWKLFDSCGVHCVTLDTIQLFLLYEKMYPLTNYTLQQMFNEVRLKIDYDVEMAYDLLRLFKLMLLEEGLLLLAGLMMLIQETSKEIKITAYSSLYLRVDFAYSLTLSTSRFLHNRFGFIQGENKRRRRKDVGESSSKSLKKYKDHMDSTCNDIPADQPHDPVKELIQKHSHPEWFPDRKDKVITEADKGIKRSWFNMEDKRKDFYKAKMGNMSPHKVYSNKNIINVKSVNVKIKWGYGFLTSIMVKRNDGKEYEFNEADLSRISLNDIEVKENLQKTLDENILGYENKNMKGREWTLLRAFEGHA